MNAVVHIGNVLDVLPTLAAGSVNCVVTSPPYWGLRDYGTAKWEGGEAECDHLAGPLCSSSSTLAGYSSEDIKLRTNGMPYRATCGKCGATRIDSQLGLEPTPDEYVAKMVAVFREVRRVLRDDGTLWLNLGDSYASYRDSKCSPQTVGGGQRSMPTKGAANRGSASFVGSGIKHKDLVGIPWRVAFALQADGWYLRSDIIWSKPNPMPESVTDRPTKAHEYVFLMTKATRYWYDAEAVAELTDGRERFGNSRILTHDDRRDCSRRDMTQNWSRNRRTVWHIATQPYHEAHFATYPEKLVEPCVLAGCPAQVCAECGAPWERLTEREHFRESERGERPSDHRALGQPQQAGVSCRVTTLGWQPTCTCNADTVPGTVLDPFTGSGTTGAVACRLGRNFVGIELNHEYAAMAERRIAPHRDQLQLVVE